MTIIFSGVASYGALGHVPPSTPNNFILVHFEVNQTANYPKYCVVCEISWCRTADVNNSQLFRPLLH